MTEPIKLRLCMRSKTSHIFASPLTSWEAMAAVQPFGPDCLEGKMFLPTMVQRRQKRSSKASYRELLSPRAAIYCSILLVTFVVKQSREVLLAASPIQRLSSRSLERLHGSVDTSPRRGEAGNVRLGTRYAPAYCMQDLFSASARTHLALFQYPPKLGAIAGRR